MQSKMHLAVALSRDVRAGTTVDIVEFAFVLNITVCNNPACTWAVVQQNFDIISVKQECTCASR